MINRTTDEDQYKSLIGKRVDVIEFARNKEAIRLTLASDRVILETHADCCSSTWIEHISGVKQVLGQIILAVEDVDLPQLDYDHEEYECLQFYGLKIRTAIGEMLIEYRNSNNRYYGGAINLVGADGYFNHFAPLTEAV